MQKIAINWFRKDLRLHDNPSLAYLSKLSLPIINIFIWDAEENKEKPIGGASKIWLHYALHDLNKQLEYKLYVLSGKAEDIFNYLIREFQIQTISWNRCYEPWRIKRDKSVKKFLESKNITARSFNGSLLWEPWEILKKDSTPYKVYSPFFKRGCLNANPPRRPIKKIKKLNLFNFKNKISSIDDLKLVPCSNWPKKISKNWKISENGAVERKNLFFGEKIFNYKDGRNFPSMNSVSCLSPYINWGQISVNELWYKSQNLLINDSQNPNIIHFLSELGWREFSYNLLYHFPEINTKNFQNKFDNFPWVNNQNLIKRWQKGETGYPIVDAGMKELRTTGYMHNRVRMIVGSFLVKNLLVDWRYGEEWFWDNLFDADMANNSAGWQWVGGSGADAAPYFRIFNPITQGQKFDPEGEYTKFFLPMLSNLPSKFLFNPWEAPIEIREKASVFLGQNYPLPIVDVKESRQEALEAFKVL
tara:strand:+ start:10920 stop:12341 length:1422 start_codon:yes stop_codon:yes gene_type:complete